MMIVKSFFRNPRNKIYMILLCLFFTIAFVLQSYNKYCTDLLEKSYYEHTMSFLFTKSDYTEILNNEKLLKSFEQILVLYPGKNNQYITSSIKEGNSSSILTEDKGKFLWSYLTYMSKDCILTFPASTYGEKLENNEVILYAVGNPESNELIKNKEISFLYNDKYLSLNVKKIEYPTVTNFILISDDLFNELMKESSDYVYYLNFYDNIGLKKLEKEYKFLEKDGQGELTYVIGYKVPADGTFTENLEKLVDFLSIIMNITSLIFGLVIIFVLIILIKEESGNNKLLKQLGLNKNQIEKMNLINLLIFNIIVCFCSIILSFFLSLILNKNFNIGLLLDFCYIFKMILFVLFCEIAISFFNVLKNIK